MPALPGAAAPTFCGQDTTSGSTSLALIVSISSRIRPKFRRCGVKTSRGRCASSGSLRSCRNAAPLDETPRAQHVAERVVELLHRRGASAAALSRITIC